MKSRSENRVAITGRSILSPAGSTIESTWQGWRDGKGRFDLIDSQMGTYSGVSYIGRCGEIDRKVLPDRKVQKAINRKDLIGLVAVLKAAQDAGIEKGSIQPDRLGMYVGAGTTQLGDLEAYFPLIEACIEGGDFDSQHFGDELLGSVNPMVMLQTLMNNTLCYASVALDVRGVNGNFMDFQASGLRAIGEAFWSIKTGLADCVIAGGVAGRPEPFHARKGIEMGYLVQTAADSGFDDQAICPYDAHRAGTVLSEGASFLVLESEAHALERGAVIFGYVDSYGLTSDARFAFIDHQPSPNFVAAMEQAYKRGAVEKAETGFIMGHGNGSVYGDSVEALSYQKFFGQDGPPVTSPKSVLGEMGEASAPANIALGLECMSNKTLLPTVNFRQGDEYTHGVKVVCEPQTREYTSFLTTARSFSGVNGCLLVSAPL